jgi:hypothetical protein
MVGLGRLELPTSSLSGMRSSHLSYRPGSLEPTWWSWSGSNRRPPECKSGALPAELQPLNSGPWFVVRGSRGILRTNYAPRTTNSKFIIEADWTRTSRTSPEIHRSFVLNLRKEMPKHGPERLSLTHNPGLTAAALSTTPATFS